MKFFAMLRMCLNHVYRFTVKLLDWGEDGMASAAETAALRASFKQEVSVWQKLDHPNVTRVNFLFSYPIFLPCLIIEFYIVCGCFNGDLTTENPFQKSYRRLHKLSIEGLLCTC